ncbi:MAG: NUDIX domain-containing protein [Nitratireductor sp.]|nr:NUDIX domain-containing protein [Nitratireductor sp.]
MTTEGGDDRTAQAASGQASGNGKSRAELEIDRIEHMINSGDMKRLRQRSREQTRQTGERIVPKNAATIVLLRGRPGHEEIIMGRRNRNLKFMPGALVFPGGRVDPGDWRVPAADPLHADVRAKLLANMRGRSGERSAHGLGIAAIRELYEETGFLIGRETGLVPGHRDWAAYAKRRMAPSLSGLRLLSRAITPPGMPRRFDTWFFVTRLEDHHHEPDEGFVHSSELEELRWIAPEAAMGEDTREITRVMLVELMNRLREDPGLDPSFPAPCYITVRDRFHRTLL